MSKTKKIIIGVIIAVIIIVAIIIGSLFSMLNSAKKKPFNTTKNVNFIISKNETFNGVLDNLANEGILRDGSLLKFYINKEHLTPKLMPGEYTINSKVNLEQFLNILNSEKTVTITIPEGYTIDQIANKLGKVGLFSESDFINAINSYKLPEFIKPVKGRKYQLEGYLFPSTYHFKEDVTPNEVIKTMLDTFVYALNNSIKQTGVKIKPEQINEFVTKASIIEREGNNKSNMSLVSAVIDNRLKAKMPLQMDATILYAMGKHQAKIYDKDLTINSPYNTYLNKGLPIGPICNPGQAALEAALKPAKSDDTYYILNGNKQFFTDNYQDFLKAKKEMVN